MATLLRKLSRLEDTRRAAVLRRIAAHLNVELPGIAELKDDDCVHRGVQAGQDD
jgi:hypothetical protein